MRSLAIVLPAGLLFAAGLHAQALTEHAAAAAGATIGTAAGKGLSNSMTKIFGDTDKQADKAANSRKPSKPVTDPETSAHKSPAQPAAGDAGRVPIEPTPFPAASQPHRRAPRPAAPPPEKAVAVSTVPNPTPLPQATPIPEPVVKAPTLEQLTSIKVGATESDVLAALGQPSSRLTIPDDDGHLRETCQYWANGRMLGTIRLDNGQVVSVEVQPQN